MLNLLHHIYTIFLYDFQSTHSLILGVVSFANATKVPEADLFLDVKVSNCGLGTYNITTRRLLVLQRNSGHRFFNLPLLRVVYIIGIIRKVSGCRTWHHLKLQALTE